MKVGYSLKTSVRDIVSVGAISRAGAKSIAGLVVVAMMAILSGCSNAPTTLSGYTSPVEAGEARHGVPPEEVLFAFEPFDGAPVNIGDSLTQLLTSNSTTYKIRIIPRVKDNATYRVRGYLVATSDDTATIISYVYDVFDTNGARVHRINGREIGAASLGDPWSAVADGTVNQIAIRTLIELRNWLYSES